MWDKLGNKLRERDLLFLLTCLSDKDNLGVIHDQKNSQHLISTSRSTQTNENVIKASLTWYLGEI